MSSFLLLDRAPGVQPSPRSMRWSIVAVCLFTLGTVVAKPVHAADSLVVHADVPGLAPSAHYQVRIRPATATGDTAWKPAFTWQTACNFSPEKPDRYFKHLAGWTHAYVNFEMSAAVEIELARVGQQPIRTAVVHPVKHVASCTVRDGKAYIVLKEPCLVAIDIDGQMDEHDTGMGYNGPPIHTVSLFANPPVRDKPLPDGAGVLRVKPGEVPPSEGDWQTLYFLPGVHDVGAAFRVHANRQYYIPGDAIVYGSISNHQTWDDGHHIRIFGLGTLSGARLPHPDFATDERVKNLPSLHNPIDIVGAADTSVEGITIADSAHHSLMLISDYEPTKPTDIRWVKIFTWRGNGDGINPFGNGLIEDCFLRTQDDSLYANGRGIRRVVLWNDYNGSSFVLSALPNLSDRTLLIEDCDVIYSRAGWNKWSGGRVFNMRGEGKGDCGAGVEFRNINIEDPRPTLQQFFINMTIPKPYSNGGESRGRGDCANILFKNISIAALSVLGEAQMLWGADGARIHHLTFDNLTVGETEVKSASFFKTNEQVGDLIFIRKTKDAK